MALHAQVPEEPARQLLHIRVPQPLHGDLKERAERHGTTLQAIAKQALEESLNVPSVDPATGLVAVFRSRYDPELVILLQRSLQVTNSFSAMGLTLLDLLSDEGWAHSSVRSALENIATVRLLLQHRDSPAGRQRIARAAGVDLDDSAVQSTPKYIQLKHAEQLIDSLRQRADHVQARAYPTYAVCRLLFVTDQHVVVEPHVPRTHAGRRPSEEHLPVLCFGADAPAAERYREHFESAWEDGRPL